MSHTSSVDFCEENYFVSKHFAEFHNTWSSLIMIFPALVGLVYANPTKEWRFTVMFLNLAFIFAGSILLHMSLEAIQQSLDEVPMLWLNNMLLYSLIELKSPRGKSKYPYLAPFMIVFCAAETVMYYTFRNLYVVFLGTFIPLTVVVVLWTGKLALFTKNVSPIAKNLYIASTISYSIIGSPLWILEMNLCHHFIPYFRLAGGMTFHILWHIGAGLGAYFMIMFLIASRVQALGGTVGLKWVLLVFPIAIDVSSVKAATTVPVTTSAKTSSGSDSLKRVAPVSSSTSSRAKSPATNVTTASAKTSTSAKTTSAKATSAKATSTKGTPAKGTPAKSTVSKTPATVSRAKTPTAKLTAARRSETPSNRRNARSANRRSDKYD